MIIAAIVIIALVLGYFLLRDPKCPKCGWRMWEKSVLWYEWRCGWCGEWFDIGSHLWKRLPVKMSTNQMYIQR